MISSSCSKTTLTKFTEDKFKHALWKHSKWQPGSNGALKLTWFDPFLEQAPQPFDSLVYIKGTPWQAASSGRAFVPSHRGPVRVHISCSNRAGADRSSCARKTWASTSRRDTGLGCCSDDQERYLVRKVFKWGSEGQRNSNNLTPRTWYKLYCCFINLPISWSFGIFNTDFSDRHSKVTPQRSISVPSLRTLSN